MSIDPKTLITELCSQFYQLGWVSGTGGGISIRHGDRTYVPPSGVQKERINPDDVFVLDDSGNSILEQPANCSLKCSECLPLFRVIYSERKAGAVIHNHSIYANLVTSINEGEYFEIQNQEMIKGIKRGSTNTSFKYNDTLLVPIIDNTLYEKDLTYGLEVAIKRNPDTNAVLVRNHGVYVWGESWESAKTMAECYDYLFRLKCEAYRMGLAL
ncbi:Methylthioribulose-1-phosphate dehydratase, partial [Fragariocoptes setiger]